MTDDDLLASPVRRDIVATLRSLPFVSLGDEPDRRAGLTAAQLAKRLSLHVTTIRFHVDQLVEGGLITARDERGSVGRPKRFYSINLDAPANVGPDAYRQLAELLGEALLAAGEGEPVLSPEEAAIRWIDEHPELVVTDGTQTTPATSPGTWLAKIGLLVDVLQRWGYAPTIATAEQGQSCRLDLHACPVRELALQNQSVACGVHCGLIRGSLDLLGETDCSVALTPFVEPHLCVALLSKNSDFVPLGGTT